MLHSPSRAKILFPKRLKPRSLKPCILDHGTFLWNVLPKQAYPAQKRTVSEGLQNLLQTQQTVDRLSDVDLQLLVEGMDRLWKQKQEQAEQARHLRRLQLAMQNPIRIRASRKSRGMQAKTRPTRLPQTSAGAGENNDQGAEGKECKLERKKQLHARKMCYYRSLISDLGSQKLAICFCA